MENNKGYRIVASGLLKNLEEKVNELLKKGYKPIGGITVAIYHHPPNGISYYQVMLKEE